MLCISCGGEMRIARIEQDAGMKAAGYEHRRLECVRCQKTERRLAFSGDSASWPIEYRWALTSMSGASGAIRTSAFQNRNSPKLSAWAADSNLCIRNWDRRTPCRSTVGFQVDRLKRSASAAGPTIFGIKIRKFDPRSRRSITALLPTGS